MISAQPVESNGPAFNKCRDDVMKRRDFLKASGLAAVGVLSRGIVAGERRRPNLLAIHTDEHNFRMLGCYRATMDPEQALMWGDAVVKGANAKSFTTDRLADKTVDFISANKDKPFCYMVSIPDPTAQIQPAGLTIRCTNSKNTTSRERSILRLRGVKNSTAPTNSERKRAALFVQTPK